MTQLERELATYRRELPGLLRDAGRFVLIRGDDVVGVFGTHEEALDAGYERYDVGSRFLVKRIDSREKPMVIPNVFPCPK
jgi:hypothetical protein